MSVSFWIISIPESFCSILNFFLLPHVKSFCVLLSVYFVRWTMLCAERYGVPPSRLERRATFLRHILLPIYYKNRCQKICFSAAAQFYPSSFASSADCGFTLLQELQYREAFCPRGTQVRHRRRSKRGSFYLQGGTC